MLRLLATVILAAACSVVHAQYKCTDSAGKVSFQQVPCSGGARSTKLEFAPSPPPDPTATREAAERAKSESATLEWRLTVRRAIEAHYPIVGMTVEELVRAIGYPRTINTSNYGRGLEEQRIYVGAYRTWYVYTRSGIVTAVQDTAGGDPVLAARANCPTSQWMRDEEVSLSSQLAADRRNRLAKLEEWKKLCV